MPVFHKGAKTKLYLAVATAILALAGGSMAAVAQNEAAPGVASQEELIAEGASVYRSNCARCHGHNGEGQRHGHDAAPRLAGSFADLSVGRIVVQVIRGGSYMPAFGSLTDREVAAVATYVRNSFGNDYGIVSVEEIAEFR